MGGKRKSKPATLAYQSKALPEQCAFQSAYYSEKGPPLIKNPRRKVAISVRGQRDVARLNKAFSKFYRMAEGDIGCNRNDSHYDLHRSNVYWDQTVRLRANYHEFLANSVTILDVGCGTGKHLRKIARSPSTIQELEAGARQMRMLGVDFNIEALMAAAAKKKILFEHHPKLAGNLQMDLLLLDLIDLDKLDLSRTCIGEEKVDIVIASDIFRWIRTVERLDLFHAIRRKLKENGYLISMEFTNPPLPSGIHLSHKLAMQLGTFSFLEPMKLGEMYAMAEVAGFGRVLTSKFSTYDEEHDPFPPLVSIILQTNSKIR